jgi:hypothetical protein
MVNWQTQSSTVNVFETYNGENYYYAQLICTRSKRPGAKRVCMASDRRVASLSDHGASKKHETPKSRQEVQNTGN